MKTLLPLAVLAALGAASTSALAMRPAAGFVLASTPVVERIAIPREQCRVEPVTTYERRETIGPAPAPVSGAGAVFGAIVGGVIGHQFGDHHGSRNAATAAGAVVGGLIGNDIEYRSAARADPGYRVAVHAARVPVTREVRHCRTVTEWRESIVGFDVRYLWNGREYVERMAHAPGRYVRVGIDVQPRHAVAIAITPRAGVPRYGQPY